MVDDDAGVNIEPAEALTRKNSLGYQVNHLARLFEQQLRIRIEGHGVVPGQFAQILALYEEEPLTQRELCDRVQIEQSTMAYTLQRMERDGLIQRVADRQDGRRMQITLTARARALRHALLDAAQQLNSLATADMDEGQTAALMSGIETMIKSLEVVNRRR